MYCIFSFRFYFIMSREASLKLYKSLLTEASKFPDFNFRNYFVRRIKDGFYAGKELKSHEEIEASLKKGHISLDMLRRQAAIGGMYESSSKLPISN